MPPAARLTDMHVCPMVTGIVPHVGGPIASPGAPTVLIGFLPAAVVGDMCVCVGPPDIIAKGSATVMIGSKPAARMGDLTAHGGAIVLGCPTVIIGDAGSGGGGGGGGGDASASAGPASGPVSAGALEGFSEYISEAWRSAMGEQYSPGITIKGDKAFRSKVRSRLDTIKTTKAGKTTLSQIDSSGKQVTIFEYKGNNSFSGADNVQAATAKGLPVFDGAGNPVNSWMGLGSQEKGTGEGSDTHVQLNPDLTLPNSNDPANPMPNDAVLFHELTHSAHQTNGNMDCNPTPGWDTAEEQRTISTGDPSEADYLDERGYPYHRTDHSVTFVHN